LEKKQRVMFKKLKTIWTLFWMHRSGLNFFGRVATSLATWFTPPYKGRYHLAKLNPKGYVSPASILHHDDLRLGSHVFIGDRIVIFKSDGGGSVELDDRVHLIGDTCIETGQGGSLKIGHDTYVQPRCQFSAYVASIEIGCGVQIAPNCAFYPYDHGCEPGELISKQPLKTKGPIIIDDDVLLGYGVIVLSGVRIGKGAVIGAGSVVTRDIPDGAIAAGVPARVIKMRSDLTKK
jgi:carbonic anhydrase/acetyltransferase-like protein (isoleucine patch superfamily)